MSDTINLSQTSRIKSFLDSFITHFSSLSPHTTPSFSPFPGLAVRYDNSDLRENPAIPSSFSFKVNQNYLFSILFFNSDNDDSIYSDSKQIKFYYPPDYPNNTDHNNTDPNTICTSINFKNFSFHFTLNSPVPDLLPHIIDFLHNAYSSFISTNTLQYSKTLYETELKLALLPDNSPLINPSP